MAYLEPALNFTASLTCSMVVGFFSSFLPPAADSAMTVVPMSVPSARYSFLMARPKMTLETYQVIMKVEVGSKRVESKTS